jgi:photosystem II stability/assembly factor-like uncharacterized protein
VATRRSNRQSSATKTAPEANGQPDEKAFLHGLEFRMIGPHRGGRVVAVAGDPVEPQVFYFGSTGGGVWKTTDGGVYWENVSDGFFKRASVGAIAVAPSDRNVIYVGMGESTIRGNVSHGDGVYKSSDGGKTWQHCGLADTRNIAKVRVHPQNPDVVYVAALGHAHGPNEERGVFRSRDGGKTWERILYRGQDAGASDLSMDPNNPRILYAAFWEARRLPHVLMSGGPGSGLFKSTDGGDTWTEITRNKGLPKGTLGKLGVAVSPARENRVYAIIEAEDGAVFRSDDGGDTWERLSDEVELRARPWYYMHIIADPQDADTLWVLDIKLFRSIDAGKTFAEMAIPHGDNHDLWIDPRDPRRMIEGNDGGATISFNGGETWSTIYNQPTCEFYHVITDSQFPYRIYGAQQDNTTISVPSRSLHDAITRADWEEIGGGESGYIAVRPDNPDVIYAGSYQGYMTRYDHRTGQVRSITVWPEGVGGTPTKDVKYRFQWTYPIVLSPHDPNTLYATGNYVFRSYDEGGSWEVISPDLTRNDASKMESSGGLVTQDNVGTEYYGTIFAFAESPVERGLLWAGSDDGLIHVSRNNGETWENVTPGDLPKWALISIIEPSPHDAATLYVAANCYKMDDFQPYLFKTSDYGQTWTKITEGIAPDDFTRAIREDPARRGLLFAGTETGLYVSHDDGGRWQRLQLNLPVVPIHDLVIHDDDLVLATHGRAFWILDDITPLRRMSDEVRQAQAHLFPPRPTARFKQAFGFPSTLPGRNYNFTGPFMATSRVKELPTGEKINVFIDAGQNPPSGVIVYYALKDKPEGDITLTFLDGEGKEIKSFSSKEPPEKKPEEKKAEGEEKKEPRVPKEAGINRFVWNMRYPDPTKVKGGDASSENTLSGPVASPGAYRVQLKVGDQTYTESFELRKDPRVEAGQDDFQAQFELLTKIRDKASEVNEALNAVRSVRQQVEEWERRSQGQEVQERVKAAADPLKEKLTAIEEQLTQVKAKKNRVDPLDFPVMLNGKLWWLAEMVASADAAPTRQSYEVFDDLSARADALLRQWHELLDTEVAAFNTLIREQGVPAIVPQPKPEDTEGTNR